MTPDFIDPEIAAIMARLRAIGARQDIIIARLAGLRGVPSVPFLPALAGRDPESRPAPFSPLDTRHPTPGADS